MSRRTNIERTAFRFVHGCVLIMALCFGSGCFAQLPVIRFVRNPDPAPEFKLTGIDGKPLSLADSRGKVILLNFWATWCGPCREEIPDLIALQTHYKGKLQIIGLVVDDDDEAFVRKVAEGEGINYPTALSPTEVRVAYGGITALPTVFLIDTEGRVVQKHVGLFNPALFETEIRALLDLPIAARVETFEDTGGVFLKHADRATALPGVDLGKLSGEQRQAALHKLNAEACTCGCKFTLAQCRIYDPACQLSQRRANEILEEVSASAKEEKPEAHGVTPGVAVSEPQKP